MKALSKMIEARVASVSAKKAASLDRVRQLLRALPPEIIAKLNQSEVKTGVAITNKMKTDKAVIQSPTDGMYSCNGSNAMTRPEILERIAQLARM